MLVIVSKSMQAVNLHSNKILQFLTGSAVQHVELYDGSKMVVGYVCGCYPRRPVFCFVLCFVAAAPHLWNMLPVYLRLCDSLGQFKQLLKTHLFGVWDRGTL